MRSFKIISYRRIATNLYPLIYKLDLGGVGPVVEAAKFGCD